MSQTQFIFIVILVVTIVYFLLSFFPKKKKLHVINIKTAKNMLEKINAVSISNPALAFGMMRKLNPFVFEELLLLAFKTHDFTVIHNHRYTGDGGIDGTIFDKRGNKYLIQAKRYKSAINPAHVENFSLIVAQKKAHAGFFIHTGRTGQKSYLHRGQNIKIISGQRLINLLMGKPFL